VSNEGATVQDVWFDDITYTQIKSPVVQADDYYAFGLSVADLSFRKASAMPNQYKYNGKEEQDELSIGWIDYGARMYDNAIGRWLAVDPLAEKARRWSPYTYAYDNPIRFIDPDGMKATEVSNKSEGGGGKQATGGIASSLGETTVNVGYGMTVQRKYLTGSVQTIVSNKFYIVGKRTENNSNRPSWTCGTNADPREQKKQDEDQGMPPSENFHFYPENEEKTAYNQMLKNQKDYGREISAYYVTKKGTKERGILVLPWAGNTYDSSNPYIGMSKTEKTITDWNGNVYIPFQSLHTHPADVRPSGADGDIGVMKELNKYFPGMNGVILGNSAYNLHNMNGVPILIGFNTQLLNGTQTLFPKKK
jgi:RHS repeat-associated protein